EARGRGVERGGATHRRQTRNNGVSANHRRRPDEARGGNCETEGRVVAQAFRPVDGRRAALKGCATNITSRKARAANMARLHIETTINGEPAEFLCDPHETLLSALRNELGLTGTKEGCSTGDCGACSVIVDGRLVPACLVLAPAAMLAAKPNPTEEETRFWLAGNLCRCTGYDKIIRAVLDTAAHIRESAV